MSGNLRESESAPPAVTADSAAPFSVSAGAADPSSAALLDGLRLGHTTAFWPLWDRHKPTLRQICLREMQGRQSDAEDALCEVMLRALNRLPRNAGTIVNLEAWLVRLTINLCTDLRRERHRHAALIDQFQLVAPTSVDEPMQHLAAEADLHGRIDSLPPFLKEPFILHAVRELSSREVAARLGLTPANVRKRVQIARARLRDQIEHGDTSLDGAGATPSAPNPSCAQPGRDALAPPVAVRTVFVTLPCGVEHMFHAYARSSATVADWRIKALRRQLESHPRSWQTCAALAEQYYLSGQWCEAISAWQLVLERHPQPAAALDAGRVLLQLGQRTLAAEIFRRAADLHTDPDALVHVLHGWAALASGDAPRAIDGFQTAAEMEPATSAHLHGLALSLELAGSIDAALAVWDRTLRQQPDDLVALSHGHELLIRAGRIEEALKRAQHLLALSPADVLTAWRELDCRCRLGRCERDTNRTAKALLRRLERLRGHAWVAREPLSAYFLARGEPLKALAVHRHFLERFPHCARTRRRYAQLLADTGSTRSAASVPHPAGPGAPRCTGACSWRSLATTL